MSPSAASAVVAAQMDVTKLFRYMKDLHHAILRAGDAMSALAPELFQTLEVRVRGRVQGVGFRPTIWRMARALGLAGEVLNDGEGVLLRIGGEQGRMAAFLDGIKHALPPLARVDAIETRHYAGACFGEFRIAESTSGGANTEIAPDARICAACAAELGDRSDRHFRYPFTSCTHCGPRLSIVTAIPYDRANTTMAPFAFCPDCSAEYRNHSDRRFHAEAIACPSCGPQVSLVALSAAAPPCGGAADAVELAANLIRGGAIVAVKGLGGYHLACDAGNAQAVGRLRQRKRRQCKPFALMARDLKVIRRYCTIGAEEERQLTATPAPIVLLDADGAEQLPQAVAPGLATLGVMLPTTPLHLLLLQDIDAPLVMTSGNIAAVPPLIDDGEARERLAGIADYALMHDRGIANRIDDSVVRVMDGKCRVLRRARGFAPSPIKLPTGFEGAPELIALGGELKATFCLIKDGQAILSQHQGDLENAATFEDYRKNLSLYRKLFAHQPEALVVDRHPEYLSSKLGEIEARRSALPLLEVQHHHAHVAACLAENGYPLDAPAVLGIVLDGLGFGDDGTVWGGEFLLADYLGYRRLARLKPVAMPGGTQAVLAPWRNLYAHLAAAMGWDRLTAEFAELELCTYLNSKPWHLLDAMIAQRLNTPPASSCGRLFDAVAAALNLCRDRQDYEGEAAIKLESLAHSARPAAGDAAMAYLFAITELPHAGFLELDPSPMWNALLSDLKTRVCAADVALRFHAGLAKALVETAGRLAGRSADRPRYDTIALSGGCFQNRILFERVASKLRAAGFNVLTHAEVPANDGGLSLGQAAIGAARLIAARAT
jgi:hydrogenase maturation protein HypF